MRDSTTAKSIVGVWRGVVITTALYLIFLFTLTLPMETFLNRLPFFDSRGSSYGTGNIFGIWEYWGTLGTLGLLHATFLILGPVPVARGRTVGKARWRWFSRLVGTLMGALIAALSTSLGEIAVDARYAGARFGWIPLAIAVGGWAVLTPRYLRRYDESDSPGCVQVVTDQYFLANALAVLLTVALYGYYCELHNRGSWYRWGSYLGVLAAVAGLAFSAGPAVFFHLVRRPDPGVARSKGEIHSSDAAWMGLICLGSSFVTVLLTLMGHLQPVGRDVFFHMALGSFLGAVVTGGSALIHLGRAYHHTKAHRRVIYFASALIAEIVALAIAKAYAR